MKLSLLLLTTSLACLGSAIPLKDTMESVTRLSDPDEAKERGSIGVVPLPKRSTHVDFSESASLSRGPIDAKGDQLKEVQTSSEQGDKRLDADQSEQALEKAPQSQERESRSVDQPSTKDSASSAESLLGEDRKLRQTGQSSDECISSISRPDCVEAHRVADQQVRTDQGQSAKIGEGISRSTQDQIDRSDQRSSSDKSDVDQQSETERQSQINRQSQMGRRSDTQGQQSDKLTQAQQDHQSQMDHRSRLQGQQSERPMQGQQDSQSGQGGVEGDLDQSDPSDKGDRLDIEDRLDLTREQDRS